MCLARGTTATFQIPSEVEGSSIGCGVLQQDGEGSHRGKHGVDPPRQLLCQVRQKKNDKLSLPVISMKLPITAFFEAYETYVGKFIG